MRSLARSRRRPRDAHRAPALARRRAPARLAGRARAPSSRPTTRTRRSGCASTACARSVESRRARPRGGGLHRAPRGRSPAMRCGSTPARGRARAARLRGGPASPCRMPPRSSRSTLLDAARGRAHPRRLRGAGRQDRPHPRAHGGPARGHRGRRRPPRGSSACTRQPRAPRARGARSSTADAVRPRRLVGRQRLRPHPARRALLGDRGDPPPPGHQAAAPAGRYRGAGAPRSARLLDALWPLLAAGRAPALHDLLGAAGRERRGRQAFLERHARGRDGTPRRLAQWPPGPARRSGPPASTRGRRPGRVLLCLPRQAGLSVGIAATDTRRTPRARPPCAALGAVRARCVFSQRRKRNAETTLVVRDAALRLGENVYELDVKPRSSNSTTGRAPPSRAGSRCASTTRSRSPAIRNYLPDDGIASLVQSYELNYHALSQRYLLRNRNTGEQHDSGSLQAALDRLVGAPQPARDRRGPAAGGRALQRARPRRARHGGTPAALKWLLFWTDDWSASSEWYSWTLQP